MLGIFKKNREEGWPSAQSDFDTDVLTTVADQVGGFDKLCEDAVLSAVQQACLAIHAVDQGLPVGDAWQVIDRYHLTIQIRRLSVRYQRPEIRVLLDTTYNLCRVQKILSVLGYEFELRQHEDGADRRPSGRHLVYFPKKNPVQALRPMPYS